MPCSFGSDSPICMQRRHALLAALSAACSGLLLPWAPTLAQARTATRNATTKGRYPLPPGHTANRAHRAGCHRSEPAHADGAGFSQWRSHWFCQQQHWQARLQHANRVISSIGKAPLASFQHLQQRAHALDGAANLVWRGFSCGQAARLSGFAWLHPFAWPVCPSVFHNSRVWRHGMDYAQHPAQPDFTHDYLGACYTGRPTLVTPRVSGSNGVLEHLHQHNQQRPAPKRAGQSFAATPVRIAPGATFGKQHAAKRCARYSA